MDQEPGKNEELLTTAQEAQLKEADVSFPEYDAKQKRLALLEQARQDLKAKQEIARKREEDEKEEIKIKQELARKLEDAENVLDGKEKFSKESAG